MKQKVLFLGSGSPFMVNAVLGNLSTAGYDVMSIELKPETVRTYAEGADAAVLLRRCWKIPRPSPRSTSSSACRTSCCCSSAARTS